ncbi:MAG TPA: 2Fe-2S iron-sulfur cluster-binding protein [Candidatus Angelobacter sp.]|jgi:xanthine dehydrogenase YagT iron-sulfur-binding subunit|nr:2Fe-2S iron-sulfur cluster-binding protein [Candidatus Angelobacter sp.]
MTRAELDRRKFLQMAAAASAVTVFPDVEFASAASEAQASGVVMRPVNLSVNGTAHQLQIDTRATLLDTLREQLQLFGTKKGCDHGQCGACTVHVNGRRVNSCLTLAVMHDGDQVTTIEGLAQGEQLSPMQAAFVEHDGFQCGYCTPGQIMSATALLKEPCGPSDDDIRECMSGNICRCGAYPNILAAVKSVRKS